MRRAPCPRRPTHPTRTNLRTSAVKPRVDTLLQDRRRLEHHHPPRRDRYLLAGLGIATDPLPLLAHHERAERGQLHRLSALETIRDLVENQLDQRSGFG